MSLKLVSVAEEWELYWAAISQGLNLSDVQKKETRRAFYSGAFSMFVSYYKISGDDVPDALALRYLDDRKDEFGEYKREVEREATAFLAKGGNGPSAN